MGKKLLILIFSTFIVACSSGPIIQYQASPMDLNKAKDVIEELTWTQHPAWRPNDFEITDKYIGWDFGTTSKTRGVGTRIGNSNVAVGGSSTTVKNLSDRSYYRSVEKVELFPWKRKFKQWYVVSLTDKNSVKKVVFRTLDIEDAKLFTDAMTTVVKFYKPQNE